MNLLWVFNMKEKLHLFYNGEFSQWYPAPIYEPYNDKVFNCCEQFMMAAKAGLFNDETTRNLIMNTKSPREQKKLGRIVKNFDEAVWNYHCKNVVYQANLLKFTQHKELLKLILSFDYDTTFVEASPYDKIWGIGFAETHPDALERSKWKGTNWLGQAITDVRNNILTFYGLR